MNSGIGGIEGRLPAEQAADKNKVVRKSAFFHPFKVNAHALTEGQTDIAAKRFDGITEFVGITAWQAVGTCTIVMAQATGAG